LVDQFEVESLPTGLQRRLQRVVNGFWWDKVLLLNQSINQSISQSIRPFLHSTHNPLSLDPLSFMAVGHTIARAKQSVEHSSWSLILKPSTSVMHSFIHSFSQQ
jgi:hypothetical protein